MNIKETLDKTNLLCYKYIVADNTIPGLSGYFYVKGENRACGSLDNPRLSRAFLFAIIQLYKGVAGQTFPAVSSISQRKGNSFNSGNDYACTTRTLAEKIFKFVADFWLSFKELKSLYSEHLIVIQLVYNNCRGNKGVF
jgi:hypothetical protein